MLVELGRLLNARNIPFDSQGNRLRCVLVLMISAVSRCHQKSTDGSRALARCFPHVVNISVTHGLTALTDVTCFDLPAEFTQSDATYLPADLPSESPSVTQAGGGYDPVSLSPIDRETEANCNTDLADDPEYAAALENDPVKRARQLVAACRASGQQREDFAAVIADGNKCFAWGPGKTLRQVQLLRDVDTRWSSTYLMIDRLLELYPVRPLSHL